MRTRAGSGPRAVALLGGWLLVSGSLLSACGNTRQTAGAPGAVASAGQSGSATEAGAAGSDLSSGGGGGSAAGDGGAPPEQSLGGQGGATTTPGNETLDSLGSCRTPLSANLFGCAGDYDTAITQPSPCGSMCAGLAGEELIALSGCTPSVGCAYDPSSRLLIGAYYGDDQATHCGGSSTSVVAGDFPAQLTFNSYDVDQNCVAPDEASVSPLFNDIFGPNDPLQVGKACRSGHDQCRGSVRLMVCAKANGQVAGDGTCQRCDSDADCTAEYPQLGPVKCEPTGLCRVGSEPVGACSEGASACLTQNAYYACVDGLCDRCTTNDQCLANGMTNVCIGGECMRAF